MNFRVSYASADEGTYENASVTPLSTWTMKAASVALPKTYHHLASLGTWCFMIGPSALETPRRSSNHRATLPGHVRQLIAQPMGTGSARTSTSSPSTCAGYWVSPCGGGPAATLPSS